MALASTAYFLGRFKQSLTHTSAGIEAYATERHAFHVTQYGLDPGVFFHCRAAQALWSLGYPEQALRRVEEALAVAERLQHPYSLVFAINNHAWISMLRSEAQPVGEHAARAVKLAEEHSFPFLFAWGQVMQGWALTAQGDATPGLELMLTGLAAPTSVAAGLRSYLLTVLADAQLKAGNSTRGLAALDEIAPGAEYFLEAERHHLRGRLLLLTANSKNSEESITAAESCFHNALESARSQHARSFELRAVVSLTKSWSQQGRVSQAEQILTPIVTWFDEGQPTADLLEARALLELGALESALP